MAVVSAAEFEKILKSKKRGMRFTKHAANRAEKRFLPLSVFVQDLENNEPVLAIEQEAETGAERKFDVYYLQRQKVFTTDT